MYYAKLIYGIHSMPDLASYKIFII